MANKFQPRVLTPREPLPCSDSPRPFPEQDQADGSAELRAAGASRRRPSWLISWPLLFLCCVAAEAAEIKGVVRLDGPIPEQEKVVIEPKKQGSHSTDGCGSLVKDSQRLQVDAEGGIRNAVIWLEIPGEPAPRASEPVLIDQSQCVFDPHVVVLPAGGEIAVRNSDSVIHNIRIFRDGKPDMLMHQWQKADAADIPWQFKEPGRYTVRCGVHHWMYAWVVVAPGGRTAVTDEKGRFTLADVPKGPQKLHVWHETLGSREVSVEAGPEEVEVQDIRFTDRGES